MFGLTTPIHIQIKQYEKEEKIKRKEKEKKKERKKKKKINYPAFQSKRIYTSKETKQKETKTTLPVSPKSKPTSWLHLRSTQLSKP